MQRTVKNLSHPTNTFSAEVKQVDTLPPYFSSHTVNILFSLFGATVLAFLCYYLVMLLLKMAPKHSTEVLVFLITRRLCDVSYGVNMYVLALIILLLAIRLMLRNQQCGISRKRKKKFTSL